MKKTYERPELTIHGNVETVTQNRHKRQHKPGSSGDNNWGGNTRHR